MLRGTSFRIACVAALALVAGCSEGSTNPRFDEVAEVTIFSANGFAVSVGASLQLEGRAVTWTGERADSRVTSWSTSDATIATVSNTGLVTGVSSGITTIKATAGGVTSIGRSVTVTPSSGPVQ